MGPSVKFVSRINGSFSKKNMGQLFSLVKKTKPEGGVRGVFGKRPDFFRFFPGPLPLAILAILVNLENLVNMKKCWMPYSGLLDVCLRKELLSEQIISLKTLFHLCN